MNVNYRLEPFGKNAPVSARDITMLHAELLPGSPITKLGPRFVERFYYTVLPRKGYIFGTVAYVDDNPAGFVVATHDSNGFMKAALRQLWWRLVYEMGLSIVLNPAIIGSVWQTLRLMQSRETITGRQPEGEILSMGVLPAYQDSQFVRKTGLRMANDLFQGIMQRLQTQDLALIRAIVDADNKPAQFFYHGVGWKMERVSVPGWEVPSVEFVWRQSVEEEK